MQPAFFTRILFLCSRLLDFRECFVSLCNHEDWSNSERKTYRQSMSLQYLPTKRRQWQSLLMSRAKIKYENERLNAKMLRVKNAETAVSAFAFLWKEKTRNLRKLWEKARLISKRTRLSNINIYTNLERRTQRKYNKLTHVHLKRRTWRTPCIKEDMTQKLQNNGPFFGSWWHRSSLLRNATPERTTAE